MYQAHSYDIVLLVEWHLSTLGIGIFQNLTTKRAFAIALQPDGPKT